MELNTRHLAARESGHIAEMNERPKLGSEERGVNVRLWVDVTSRYFRCVALRMTLTVSSGMSHIGK